MASGAQPSRSRDESQAKTLYERALAIWEASLGPDHPHVAQVLNNLANAHLALGQDAIALAEQARDALRAYGDTKHADEIEQWLASHPVPE